MKGENDKEKGILFKLLQIDKRIATVMAFDMIFAGIDTVRNSICRRESFNFSF